MSHSNTRSFLKRSLTKRLLLAAGSVTAGLLAVVIAIRFAGAASTVTLTQISTQTAANYTMYPITQASGAPPLVMLVLSRDEQLSIKAYTDYTDLNGDGIIDTTYIDNFNYGGYFDSTLCYTYNTLAVPASYIAVGQVGGTATSTNLTPHQCNISGSNQWSGNFLNWLTMTRMDIVRSSLFGGKRYIDTAVSGTTLQQTVLQRSYLPSDVHSFQKVYPNTNHDIGNYMPLPTSGYTGPVSFCNTSDDSSRNTALNAFLYGYTPVLKVAEGTFPEWAATEQVQCDWQDYPSPAVLLTPNLDQPRAAAAGSTVYNVFVDVCDNPSYRESFCRSYVNGNVTTYKPAGLLQQYGEAGTLRFGLVTGTYTNPRTGGAVRRNIGRIAGNDPAAATGCYNGGNGLIDEVNFQNGVFCNFVFGAAGTSAGGIAAGTEGIINTIQRLQITQWYNDNYGGPADCSPGTYVRDGTTPSNSGPVSAEGLSGSPTNYTNTSRVCSDWHNPLAEMYAEALRYIEGNGNKPTAAFSAGGLDNALGLPYVSKWNDPYSAANYCAKCSIIVLSTGFGSFDSDEIPGLYLGADSNSAQTATTRLGSTEQTLSSTTGSGASAVTGNDTIGYYGLTPTQSSSSSSDYTQVNATGGENPTEFAICSSKAVADLALVRGICPQQPVPEGSYYLAGLAFDAWTHDLRPDLTNSSGALYPGIRNVKTFAVSLAETLPSFSFKTSGGTISLAPLCKSLFPPSYTHILGLTTPPAAPTGESCSLNDVSVQPVTSTSTSAPFKGVTFGVPTAPDGTSGSFILSWDDSPWGNDHDRDIVEEITYCVGSACAGSPICTDYIFSNVAGSTLNTSPAVRNACASITKNSAQPLGNASTVAGNTVTTLAVGTNQVLVRTEMISASTSRDMVAGFTVSGSGTTDGPYAIIGHLTPDNGLGGTLSSVLVGTGVPCASSPCATTPNALGLGPAPVVNLFTASGTTSNTLQNPLFYAAKYGGFAYTSGNSPPESALSSSSSWDQLTNSTGQPGADGLPDNYFPVSNPGQLGAQLGYVLQQILRTSGSGSAAAVVANQAQGVGATYQATYDASVTDSAGRTATWLGQLQSLFVDSEGNLREAPTTASSDGSVTLNTTDFTANPAVTFYYDTTGSPNQTKFCEFTTDPMALTGSSAPSMTTPCPSPGTSKLLTQLNPILNVRNSLAKLTNAQVIANRAQYQNTADTGRYIFTFIDQNLDGKVSSGETLPFLLSSFQNSTGNTYGLLNVADATSAQNLINYIRGQDFGTGSGIRSRTVDYYNTGTASTYRLGDIVDSSPIVVGAPDEKFDLIYNDQTYSTFHTTYQRRRNVAYVGANDGMLHAFNGGFFNVAKNDFELSGDNSEPKHPLGSELWAFVPFNLLPHLIWLTSPNYGHVFYFDGAPRVFDMHIFNNDGNCTPVSNSSAQSCHPYGWGTVMVVGMRFGGGDLDLPASNCTYATAFNGFSPGSSLTKSCSSNTVPKTDVNTHSAYAVFDITNPEQPPTLLAELGTDPFNTTNSTGLGFTTSFPTSAAFSTRNNSTSPTTDLWYLLFGNGPGDIGTATSTRDAKLYVYNLSDTTSTPNVTLSTSFDFGASPLTATSSFTGDPVSVDWDLDFKADNIYVGTASGSSTAPTGQLFKITTGSPSQGDTSKWTASLLTNPKLPVLETPSVAIDSNNQHWVYAGSGRLYVGNDKANNVNQQTLFGVIDGTTSPTYSSLLDVSNASVNVSTQVITGVAGVTSEPTLETAAQNGLGWKTALSLPTDTTTSAERVLSPTTLFGKVLFATTYIPNTSLCMGQGTSNLYAVNYITGVVNPNNPALGTITSGSYQLGVRSVPLGQGLATTPNVHVDATNGADGKVTIVSQTSTGAITTQNASVAPTVPNGEIYWSDPIVLHPSP